MGEEIKIKSIIEKYLVGEVCDIGCGDSPITENAFGIDGRDFPCVKFRTDQLYNLYQQIWHSHPEKFDCVHSSHCAEHLPDMWRTINDWGNMVKQGGYLILQLPDGEYYNNYDNPEHFHDTRYKPFLFWFKQAFCGEGRNFKGEQYAPPVFELIESGQDVEKENHYSFYLVAKKL